jgi:hypothetical protein
MVDRCVCFEKKFSEMKIIAGKYNLKNIKELKEYIVFGENCKFCLPYVELMLETGKTEFEPLYFDGSLSE